MKNAKTLLEAATAILLNEEQTIKLSVPFGPYEADPYDDAEVYKQIKKATILIQKIAKQNGFKITKIADEIDVDELVYATLSGPKTKLLNWLRGWMKDSDSTDAELMKDYQESYEPTIKEGEYSVHSPMRKIGKLRAALSVKKLEGDKLDYVFQVIAAHVTNQQLGEIISYLKK
jgi:tRNA nucleotidyltransferase (CCA-adding enzyme)